MIVVAGPRLSSSSRWGLQEIGFIEHSKYVYGDRMKRAVSFRHVKYHVFIL